MKPTKNIYFCIDCGRSKMLFESKEKAERFLKFNKQKIEKENGSAPQRAYYCMFCLGWHITSIKEEFGKSKLEKSYEQYREGTFAGAEGAVVKQQQAYQQEQEMIILKHLNSLPDDEVVLYIDSEIDRLIKEIQSIESRKIYRKLNLASNHKWMLNKYRSFKKLYRKGVIITWRKLQEDRIIGAVSELPITRVESYVNSKIETLNRKIVELKKKGATKNEELIKDFNFEVNVYYSLRKSYRAKLANYLGNRLEEIKVEIERQIKPMSSDDKLAYLNDKIDTFEKKLSDFIIQRDESDIDDKIHLLMKNELKAYEEVKSFCEKEISKWERWSKILEGMEGEG